MMYFYDDKKWEMDPTTVFSTKFSLDPPPFKAKKKWDFKKGDRYELLQLDITKANIEPTDFKYASSSSSFKTIETVRNELKGDYNSDSFISKITETDSYLARIFKQLSRKDLI